jgi:streptogramin lyase
VWFTNEGSASIGRIDVATGRVTTFTGPGIDIPFGIVHGPDGALWFTNRGNSSIGRITTTGHVTNYRGPGVSNPDGIAVSTGGALWFTNHGNNSIGRITTSGHINNYTGTGINGPDGIVAGPDGAMWFTNQSGNSIGRITTNVTPQISGFTPTSGAPGTTVTIRGINLSKASKVTFAGTTATISSDTATTIVTAVPTGASSGHISVTTRAGTTTSTQTFTVT